MRFYGIHFGNPREIWTKQNNGKARILTGGMKMLNGRNFFAFSFLVTLLLTVGCSIQLKTSIERTISVQKLSCISPTFNEVKCNETLKTVNEIIKEKPYDLWARSERADINHIIAIEKSRLERENDEKSSNTDFKARLRQWKEFLKNWNNTYKDVQHFDIIQTNRNDSPGWVEFRVRRILGDFFFINGEYASRLSDSCTLSDGKCNFWPIIAGELFRISSSIYANAFIEVTEKIKKEPNLSLNIVSRELCNGFYASYAFYNTYRSREIGDPISEVMICDYLSKPTKSEGSVSKIFLDWKLNTVFPGIYSKISLGYTVPRIASLEEANNGKKKDGSPKNIQDKKNDWIKVVNISENSLLAQISSELLSYCSSTKCEEFPDNAISQEKSISSNLLNLENDIKSLKNVK
jgi:hypothetical protein